MKKKKLCVTLCDSVVKNNKKLCETLRDSVVN